MTRSWKTRETDPFKGITITDQYQLVIKYGQWNGSSVFRSIFHENLDSFGVILPIFLVIDCLPSLSPKERKLNGPYIITSELVYLPIPFCSISDRESWFLLDHLQAQRVHYLTHQPNVV